MSFKLREYISSLLSCKYCNILWMSSNIISLFLSVLSHFFLLKTFKENRWMLIYRFLVWKEFRFWFWCMFSVPIRGFRPRCAWPFYVTILRSQPDPRHWRAACSVVPHHSARARPAHPAHREWDTHWWACLLASVFIYIAQSKIPSAKQIPMQDWWKMANY